MAQCFQAYFAGFDSTENSTLFVSRNVLDKFKGNPCQSALKSLIYACDIYDININSNGTVEYRVMTSSFFPNTYMSLFVCSQKESIEKRLEMESLTELGGGWYGHDSMKSLAD